MTPQQRAAALRLADWHEAYMWHEDADATTVVGKNNTAINVNHRETADLLRELAKEPQAEPVAWYFEARHIDSAWGAAVSMKHPGAEGAYMRKVTPLYAHPPQRRHLSDEQVSAFVAQVQGPPWLTVEQLIRAVEAAHGIKEAP